MYSVYYLHLQYIAHINARQANTPSPLFTARTVVGCGNCLYNKGSNKILFYKLFTDFFYDHFSTTFSFRSLLFRTRNFHKTKKDCTFVKRFAPSTNQW